MDSHTKDLLATARDHYEKEEFEKAEALLREIASHHDRFADVYNMLGVIAHSRGDTVVAAQHFERAVTLNPSYTEALLNLAVTYNDLGNYDAALSIRSHADRLRAEGPMRLDPFARGKLANMHADVSEAYAEIGMLDDAIAELLKAVELCPTFADLRTRLGTLYREQGDLARARDQFAEAKEANLGYMPARVMLGLTQYSLGNRDLAVEEWREVLVRDPSNKSAQMYLRMAQVQSA